MSDNYKAVLLAVVELLIEQSREHKGEIEGVNIYQALNEIKVQADAAGLSEKGVGLDGFDVDGVLTK